MWNNKPPPQPQAMPVQPMSGSNVAWNQAQQPADPSAYYGQMTPEQYKQWETYYQRYAAWYAQYGEQYAKLQGAAVAPPPTNPYPGYPTMPANTGMYPQPPPPQDAPPAPPPPSEPPNNPALGYVAAKAAPVTYQQQPPPAMTSPQQEQPYHSQLSKWNHTPQIKVNQRIQYGSNRNNMGQQNRRNDNQHGGFNFSNGQGNIPQNRRIYPSHNSNNTQGQRNISQPPPNVVAPPPIQSSPSKNADEPSEEEKYFDDQFKKWEEEFDCWKKQNANHPDKKAYAEYEKKFTDVRAKLLERREQMRRKKQTSLQQNQPVQVKTEPVEEPSEEVASPQVWQPQPISNKSSEPLKPESIFLSNTSGGTIPGLDFDTNEIKQEPEDDSDTNKSKKKENQTKPLLDLTENIQNAPHTNDLMQQLDLLLENSQVSALLTLVNLTNENPNSIQLNALKPIIEALKTLTEKSDKEILKALAQVSMKLNNYEPESVSEPPVQETPAYVHVATAGITVIPPLVPPETQHFPNMMQPPPMEQPWSQGGGWNQNNWQQPPPGMWNTPPPPPPSSSNNIQARLMGLSQPNNDFLPRTKEIDYSHMRQPSFSEEPNVVDYGHGGVNNRNFNRNDFHGTNTIDYGHSTSLLDNRNNDNRRPNTMGPKQNQRNPRNKNFQIEKSIDYGESNPTYPGKWILISERPPLIRRTKRGKRKNRKGQIIESKKWPSNKNETGKDTQAAPKVAISVKNDKTGVKSKNNVTATPTTSEETKIKEKNLVGTETLPTKVVTDVVVPTYGAYPQTTTLRFHKNTVSLDDILLEPGRFTRPPKIVIIMRGPPGSGKSVLSRLIKDQENVIGGTAPRILSIDDYYTIEEEKEVIDTVTGKKTMKVESVYQYEPGKEDNYMQYLMRSFKKNLTDNLFNFIIIDAWNDKLHQYFEIHDIASKCGYTAYTIELLYALDVCLDHNVHNRSTSDIKNMIINWKSLPPKHILLDATNLIQFSMNEAMETAASDNKESIQPNTNEGTKSDENKEETEVPIDTPMDSIEVDLAEDQENEDNSDEVEEIGFLKSKWEDDVTENKLARLDGVSKPLRHQTIEDYLQMDGWEPPKASTNGKKRVRWADIEAKREQDKMKQIGFVVGHTDWNKMMDPTEGSSALCDIKYIEKAPKFRKFE